MQKFIHLRSAKFPVLPGEEEGCMNPGTCGQALAEYVQHGLVKRGWKSPIFCGEDWGWWVEVALPATSTGVCCRREGTEPGECELVCYLFPGPEKVWSWKRLRKIDLRPELERLQADLEAMFRADPDIAVLGVLDQDPLLETYE